jgi:hypothetical protein
MTPSERPLDWDGFFAALVNVDVPDEFLSGGERHQGVDDRAFRQCTQHRIDDLKVA